MPTKKKKSKNAYNAYISIGFDLGQHNILYPHDKSYVLNFETLQRSWNRSMGYGWNAVIEISIG